MQRKIDLIFECCPIIYVYIPSKSNKVRIMYLQQLFFSTTDFALPMLIANYVNWDSALSIVVSFEQ